MTSRFLLDSVILIDHFNGVSQATTLIEQKATVAAISVITRAEVLAGFDEQNIAKARSLLDCFRTHPIDNTVADLGAQLRRSLRVKLPDALQAAVAVSHDLVLLTRNTKDFKGNKHPLRYEVPYEI